MLCQRFPAGSHGERGAALLPGIADQPYSGIANGVLGRSGEEHSLPALVLVNIERTLIQTFPHRRSAAEVVALPEVRGDVCRKCGRQHDSAFEEVSATH